MQNTDNFLNMARPFCQAGLYLVPIPKVKGQPTKAPSLKEWNQPRSEKNKQGYSSNINDFSHYTDINLGLYHAASQTVALDLDDLKISLQVIEQTTGITLTDWLNDSSMVQIKSPKLNRAKLLFKLPEGFTYAVLRQLKNKTHVVFELRAGNCQDVIYGHHPEGGEYQLIGDPSKIPFAPAVLLDFLQHWEEWKPCFYSALGIESIQPKIQPRKPQASNTAKGQRNPIEEFNQANAVQTLLINNGYRLVGKDRLIRPKSTSNAPGAILLHDCADGIERVFSHGGDALNDGFAHDAFDCYRILECDRNFQRALNWNAEITQHNQRLFMQAAKDNQKQKTSSVSFSSCAAISGKRGNDEK